MFISIQTSISVESNPMRTSNSLVKFRDSKSDCSKVEDCELSCYVKEMVTDMLDMLIDDDQASKKNVKDDKEKVYINYKLIVYSE